MKHLLDIISVTLVNYSYSNLSSLDLWEGNFRQMQDHLKKHISLGEKWLDTLSVLTGTLWKANMKNPWKGGKYEDPYLAAFYERLSEVRLMEHMPSL